MNKALIYAVLALQIVVSIVAGTLATYSKSLVPIEGSVQAKQFFIGTNESYYPEIKLAPSESMEWNFSVVNHIENLVTEVDMDVTIIVEVDSLEQKTSIEGLTVSLYNEGNKLGDTIINEGSQTFIFKNAFTAYIKSEKNFTLKVEWVNGAVTDETDTENADMQSTTRFRVRVIGSQSAV